MKTHTVKPLGLLLAALFWVVAPPAESGIYRWLDEQGAVTYGNQPPSNQSAVRDLTLIDDTTDTLTSSEMRTLEILNAERETPVASGNRFGSITSGVDPDPGGDAPATPQFGAASNRPEAVRDPCLTSPDPRCSEKNQKFYVPGRGYSPSAARAARESEALASVGVSGSTAGGGSLEAAIPRPAHLAPPKSSNYALPPGTELPNPKP